MNQEHDPVASTKAASGIAGLDTILGGGLPPHRLYLVQGNPGVGKTTLALQFLLEGARQGETVLYITLSETKEELTAVARSHGWSLDAITIFELNAIEDSLKAESQNTLFQPAEVELIETTRLLLEQAEALQPTRVVLDSLSEFRLLAQTPLRYRRQILALKQFFAGRKCTLLLLDDMSPDAHDLQVQSVAHGVICLEHVTPEYGATRRRLRIAKVRGVAFCGGYHDFEIGTGGLCVFPRLVAAEYHREYAPERVSTGISQLDALLGGGLDRGTSSLLIGAAGTGKSTLALQCALEAAARGERVAIYSFEEGSGLLRTRARALGLDLDRHLAAGQITIRQVDPAEMSPGEFAFHVRQGVEERQVRMVTIDSLNGYFNAMPKDNHLALHLHELFSYLNQQGVVTIIVAAQHGMVGTVTQPPIDVSYLADCVILLRHFEAEGQVRQAISVVKKRTGAHERTIREFAISSTGVRVGPPLREFEGVLSGVPLYLGARGPLIEGATGEAGKAGEDDGRDGG